MRFRKNLTLLTLLICGATITQQSLAQSSESSQTLTLNLEKAIEIALSDNPTIKIAGLEIERQRYIRKETEGNLMPNLSGSGSYMYNIMNQVMFLPEGVFGPGSGGAMRMGFANSFTGGFTLSLPLYMPTIYKTLQLNEQQMLSAVEAARSSKIELANQVKMSYYAILLGENSLSVIQDNIKLAELIVTNTDNAYKQGLASEYDLITAQVQLSNLRPTLIATENSIRNTRLMLNMLLYLPPNIKVVSEQRLTDYSAMIESGIDTSLVDLSDNSDLKKLELQKAIMNKQLELQKSTRIPTLSAVAQYQVLTQSNDFNLGAYQWRGTAAAGIQLSIPIFAGLSKIQKQNQIKNSQAQLSIQYDYLEQNLNVQALTAQSNMLKAKEQTVANGQAMGQAEKGYQIAKTRYDVGAGTITDLNSAQMAKLTAGLNYSQSLYDYLSALADYEKILGKIN